MDYRLASGRLARVPTPEERAVLKLMGERLRARREELRLSQAALAEAAGVHVTYVSGLERGLRNPSILVLRAMCAALDVNLEDIAT